MVKLINEHYDNNVIELWKDNNGELIAIMPDNRGYSVYFNYEDGGNDYTFGSRYSHVSSIEDAEDTIMKRRPNARRIDNTNESISRNKSIKEHTWKHQLSNNPTDYERYVNYAESLIQGAENIKSAAETYLYRIENDADFYADEKNARWYDYENKMNKIASMITKLETLANQIRKLTP